jgi:hypothetical protein
MKVFRAPNLSALALALITPFAPTLAQVQPELPYVSLKPISERIFPQPQPPNFSANLLPSEAISSSTDSLDLTPLPITPPDPSDFSSQSFTIAEKTSLSLLPEGSCTASDYGLLPTCLFPLPSHFNTWDSKPALYPAASVQSPPRTSEKFNWKGAFWQSFGFLVAGHAFRLANDDGARYLLFHKPFWHDYWSSTAHFDMSRWGDGDSFIVNYIGHPMEGAVYGNIFINNDPKGRAARFGKSSNYWYSRLKAMAWSTAWEAYFEIGPVFSEAAIGNEGGYTYVPGCGLYPCDKYPGKTFKPPTNNTGWVDFVITPVVGMGWMVLEDAIEREFVDRLADGSTALKYKILRGSLTPTHTFANLFAGKVPWHRYPEEGSFQQSFGGPLHPVERPAWKADPRFSLGVQYISMDLPLDSETCQNCRQFYSGYGFDFTYRLAKYAWFDSIANIFPGAGSSGEHGGVQEGLVGFKFGRSLGNWGIYSNLRNGFMHYDKTLLPGSTSTYESTWRYVLDLGGTVEYYTSSHSTIRFNAGTALIHYLEPSPDTSKYQPAVGVISTQYYSFQGSPYLTTGYVFRF